MGCLNVGAVRKHDTGPKRSDAEIGEDLLVLYFQIVIGCTAVGFGYYDWLSGWVCREAGKSNNCLFYVRDSFLIFGLGPNMSDWAILCAAAHLIFKSSIVLVAIELCAAIVASMAAATMRPTIDGVVARTIVVAASTPLVATTLVTAMTPIAATLIATTLVAAGLLALVSLVLLLALLVALILVATTILTLIA